MKKGLLAVWISVICVLFAGCSTTVNVNYPHLHEYDGVWAVTETDHKRQCIECNEVNEGSKSAHTWDERHICIICHYEGEHTWKEGHECRICGYQGEHSYGEWTKDENADTHSRTCECGSSLTENCAGGEATTEEKAVCEVCGEGYGALVSHDYENGSWITDEAEHKKQCADCSEIDESTRGAHAWDDTHKCTVCSYQGTHAFGEEWVENTEDGTHDYTCICGRVNAVACDCNAWDGTVGTLPETVNDELILSSAAELAAFAKSVNEGNNYFGKTVKLSGDINLGNQFWTPIGSASTHAFRGNFDGQGHTIKNMKVAVTNEIETTEAGLFGWIQNSSIKNVTIEGLQISGEKRVGGIVGYIEVLGGTVVIENCHVKRAVLEGDRVGGIVGYVNPNVTIRGCSVTDTTITAKSSQGKIVGYNNNAVSENNKVENVTLVNELKDTFEI